MLFVAAADQLPPVGPGAPFHHLCRAAPLPVARLSRIYRTDAGGSVARAAREVNGGRAPRAPAGDPAFRAAVFPRAPRHLPKAQHEAIGRKTREAMAGRVDEVRRLLAAGSRPADVQGSAGHPDAERGAAAGAEPAGGAGRGLPHQGRRAGVLGRGSGRPGPQRLRQGRVQRGAGHRRRGGWAGAGQGAGGRGRPARGSSWSTPTATPCGAPSAGWGTPAT